jgi:hypothetical protein
MVDDIEIDLVVEFDPLPSRQTSWRLAAASMARNPTSGSEPLLGSQAKAEMSTFNALLLPRRRSGPRRYVIGGLPVG